MQLKYAFLTLIPAGCIIRQEGREIMKNHFKINHALAVIAGATLFISHSVLAQMTCVAGTQRTDTYALTPGTLSAGPDMPLGSIIYNMTWNDNNIGNQIICNTDIATGETATTPGLSLGVDTTPYPLSSWTGSPFPGKVYSTNIPGIGFAVWQNGNAATKQSPLISGPYTITIEKSTTTTNVGSGAPIDVSLIKIGNTPPGQYTINASTFPVVTRFWPASSVLANTVISRRIAFTGTLTVAAQTCTTPDVNVGLGSYDVSSFNNSGSSTPWVDASITLTNCPVFQGYYPNATNSVKITGSTATPPAPKNNQFGVILSPVNGVIDAANGIMNVTPTAHSAKGIGIQIANGTTSSVGQFFNMSMESKINAPTNGRATISIPLVARYIKTDTTVTPGRADGKVTFTINYY